MSKQAFKYTCSYCGMERNDDEWWIDTEIFGHKAYFDKDCVDMLKEYDQYLGEYVTTRIKNLINKEKK